MWTMWDAIVRYHRNYGGDCCILWLLEILPGQSALTFLTPTALKKKTVVHPFRYILWWNTIFDELTLISNLWLPPCASSFPTAGQAAKLSGHQGFLVRSCGTKSKSCFFGCFQQGQSNTCISPLRHPQCLLQGMWWMSSQTQKLWKNCRELRSNLTEHKSNTGPPTSFLPLYFEKQQQGFLGIQFGWLIY